LGLAKEAPIESLEALLDASPEVSLINDWNGGGCTIAMEESTQSWNGNIPLHMALRGKFPGHFLIKILEANRDAVRTRDREGQLPLHLAIIHGSEINFIELILREFPLAAE
jgi:hypothetical protein